MTARMDPSGGFGVAPESSGVFAGTPFQLVHRLSEGRVSELFLVEHIELKRRFVAKVLQPALARDPEFVDRIRVEAQSLGRIKSDNVVSITDYRAAHAGRPFLVMEHLAGRSLAAELEERGAFPLLQALDFAHQTLNGLGAVHATGIVHRDVKPQNLFLSEAEVEGEMIVTLKLIDFGLARVLPGVSDQSPRPLMLSTKTGAVLGTPRYLSPEAALGKRADQRADLYAVSLVLFEMLAGCGPFEHLKHDFLTAHRAEAPLPPSHYAARPIPRELDAVVLRGLAKDPSARYQTAEEFQRELEWVWHSLQCSQHLHTTFFAPAAEGVRTSGQLWRQPASSRVPRLGERELSASDLDGKEASSTARSEGDAPASASLPFDRRGVEPRRASSALLATSVLLALATAAVFTFVVFAMLSKWTP